MTSIARAGWLLWLLGGCGGDESAGTAAPDPYDVPIGPYEAEVRWTAHGIPHILAKDHGSLAYGMGFAHARDHVCTLADQIVKVRSQRARYFGPGEESEHLDSDFGWLALGVMEQARAGFLDLEEEVQRALVGYATGYNDHLEEVGPQGLPEMCREAPWVQPITHIDLLAYYLHLGQFASGYELVEMIATAAPPLEGARRSPPPDLSVFEDIAHPPIGSNGWAIGEERSASGRGMLLSNTHFPSAGERQWHESHLSIPGQVDVYGVSLIGVPLINMGFTRGVAWSHTVSNTPRMTFYELDLDPDNPLRYAYDGGYREMEAVDYAIEVLQPDGSLEIVWRTLYRSHYGPVLNAPLVGWTPLNAFTYRDVNDGNLAMIPTWFAMNQASTLDEFIAAHREHQGIPWVHTVAADAEGRVWYADSAATPNLGPEAESAYERFLEEDVFAGIFAESGILLLDGGDPVFEWVDDPSSALPYAIPFDAQPQLERRDFVSNANENHWLANPYAPLTGYSWLYGPVDTPRTPRTRMNNMYLMQTGEGTAAGADGRFDLAELEAAALSARASLAELLLDQVVERCESVEAPVEVELDGQLHTVELAPACAALAAWDGRAGLDSPGIAVWREFLGAGFFEWDELRERGPLFADDFDPTDPIGTPNTLVPPGEDEAVLHSLAAAILRLEEAGIALDATLRELQFRQLGEERVPTLGGPYHEGVIAVASYETGGNSTLLPQPERGELINESTALTTEGYRINSGNSWVMAMQFGEEGPEARAVMVYAQSEDPASPYFADQAWLYAEPTLREVRFEEADVLADPELEQRSLSHPAE